MKNTLQITACNWQEQSNVLTRIRHDVFILEQNVPVEEEIDEHDPSAQHFLVTVDNATELDFAEHLMPVACARWVLLGNGFAKIGRFAVIKEYRHNRIGYRLLKFMLDFAKVQNIRELQLSAQISAIGFYEQQGFKCYGQTFMDAGIPHKSMHLTLN